MSIILALAVALAAILAATRTVGSLSVKLGQPRVIGEIVAGVLLGPSLLGLVGAPQWLPCQPETVDASMVSCLFPSSVRGPLDWLGQAGVLVYMLSLGFVLDRAALGRAGRGIASVGAGMTLPPLLAGAALAPLLTARGFAVSGAPVLGVALLFGAMLAITAVPVAARILDEYQLLTTPLGNISVAAASACTIATCVVLSVAASTADSGSGLGGQAAAAVGMVVAVAVAWRWGQRLGADRHRETVLLVVGTALVAGALSHLSGLTVVTGGLAAGLVAPRRPSVARLRQQVLAPAAERVLLPVFFALSGLAVDLGEVSVTDLGIVVLVLLCAVGTKMLGGAAAARATGFATRDSLALGALANCRGLMVLIVGLKGLDAGLLTTSGHGLAVLIALLTTAMTGPLVTRLLSQRQAQPSPP